MNEENKNYGCSCGTKLVFACSGAADVGAVADQAARKMSRDGTGKMFCTAGLGGKVPAIIETAQAACCIVALDGCPADCVKLSLENAGFSEFIHLRVTDLGFEKGKTDVSDDTVTQVAEAAAEKNTCC